jgi:hypothetical protein
MIEKWLVLYDKIVIGGINTYGLHLNAFSMANYANGLGNKRHYDLLKCACMKVQYLLPIRRQFLPM